MTSKTLPCPTVTRLLINYDHKTGKMTWKNRPVFASKAQKNNHCKKDVTRRFNQRYAGTPALQSKKGNGYLYGNILARNTLAHRAAWCIFYGAWPESVIDHINGNRSDNRIENLRDVSCSENNQNRIRPPKYKHYGICRNMNKDKWVARIVHKGKLLHLGTFDSEDDAANARIKAEKKLWGGSE